MGCRQVSGFLGMADKSKILCRVYNLKGRMQGLSVSPSVLRYKLLYVGQNRAAQF